MFRSKNLSSENAHINSPQPAQKDIQQQPQKNYYSYFFGNSSESQQIPLQVQQMPKEITESKITKKNISLIELNMIIFNLILLANLILIHFYQLIFIFVSLYAYIYICKKPFDLKFHFNNAIFNSLIKLKNIVVKSFSKSYDIIFNNAKKTYC